MTVFNQGDEVESVHVYGPADTDFSSKYYEMRITMESGQYCGIPWIAATHRTTGETTMINCDKCACIKLSSTVANDQGQGT